MTIENVPLFPLVTPEDLTAQQVLDAYNKAIDPRTGKEDSDFHDEFYEGIQDVWSEKYPFSMGEGESLGSFVLVTDWNGGDGREMGRVIRHVESGNLFLLTGTYSSWDSSEWDELKACEPYEFTETRYRAV